MEKVDIRGWRFREGRTELGDKQSTNLVLSSVGGRWLLNENLTRFCTPCPAFIFNVFVCLGSNMKIGRRRL